MKAGPSILSELLKEERIAEAAYRAVDRAPETGPAGVVLRRLEREHTEAARLIELGSNELSTETEAGEAWQAWAQAVRAGAHHLGTAVTLDALRRGEEQVRRDLERALADENVPFELRDVISSRLLPRTLGRIAALEQLRHRI